MCTKVTNLCSVVVLACVALLIFAESARAADIPVTTPIDELTTNGACSLREAIQSANTDSQIDNCSAGAGADVILLPAGTYTLTISGPGEDANLTGDLDILGDVQLVGQGVERTVVDGNGLDRVLHIHAGADVTVDAVAIVGGRASGGPAEQNGAHGGGIYNDGLLTVRYAALRSNHAGRGGDSRSTGPFIQAGTGGSGGGVYSSGELTVTESVFIANAAGNGGAFTAEEPDWGSGGNGGFGGGIYATGTAKVSDSLLAYNRAGSPGGTAAIFGLNGNGGSGGGLAVTGALGLARTQLTGNMAFAGGALASTGNAQIAVVESNFFDNATWSEGGGISPPGIAGDSGGPGGAIYHQGGDFVLVRSTVHHNETGSGGSTGFGGSHAHAGSGGSGGGIFNAGDMVLRQSTVSNNRTGHGGSFSTWGGDGGSGGGVYSSG